MDVGGRVMGDGCRVLGKRGAFALALLLVFASSPVLSDAGRVGVVDSRLLSYDYWVKPFAAEWQSDKIAGIFAANGVQAEVIGADVLLDLAKLKSYRAVIIPTDHNYPNSGSREGPVARSLRDFVRSGGIYIAPMGAGHARWKDIDTGVVSEDMGLGRDFLGLEWVLGADQNIPGPGLMVTDSGKRAGLTLPPFPEPFSTWSRSVYPAGDVYLLNGSGKPSLYVNPLGRGAVMHYAGGLPFSPQVRDYIVGCYASILKSGLDAESMRKAAIDQIEKYKVYTVVPVSERDSACQIRLDGEWELAEAKQPTIDADETAAFEWTRVAMPASIQYALFRAGKIENPWIADNNKKLQWISQSDWCLRKRFTVPADWKGRRIRLRFDGVDYLCSIWLDNVFLGTHEGMMGGPTFDITDSARPGKEHELMVRIYAGKGRSGDIIKPDILCAMSYWGNKYWSMGIWRSVRLVATGDTYLEAPLVRTEAVGSNSADLWAQVMLTNTGADFQADIDASILDPSGKVVWRKTYRQLVPSGGSYWEQSIKLADPKLWWPNGMGDHPLYRMQLTVKRSGQVLDAISTRFGVRTLEIKRNPYVADSPRRTGVLTATPDEDRVMSWQFENSDEGHKFLFVVNGRPFYAKGVSWLMSDDLLMLTPERESWMVRAAKMAGVNLFRLNGGTCIFETEQFYDLCDENGILVWQELIFNWDGSHGSSLAVWRDQLTQNVLRLRQHPSLALYCGGNEYGPYGTALAPFLGTAREVFDAYDNRGMRMASPGGHGTTAPGGGTYHAYIIPEVWTGDPNWYPRIWNEGTNFISEWSIYAYNNYSCLRRIIPKEEIEKAPIGHDFDAFRASHPLINVERYCEPGLAPFNFMKASWYGDLGKASVKDLSEYSQMGHAQTVGYAMEHWRSQFPYTGGQTFWTYNIPQPASSWNIIDWFGQPVMAYYAMKRANEPVHVVANTNWFSWGPGDTFKASVWAINDGPVPIKGAKITARVLDPSMKQVASKSWSLTIPANGYRSEGAEIAWPIPSDSSESCFFLEVTLSGPIGDWLSQQVHWMRVLKSLADPEARRAWQAKPSTDPICKTGPWLKPQMESLPTSISATLMSAKRQGADALVTIEVRNTGKLPAFPVRIAVEPDACSSLWSDNFFWLAPGEKRRITGVVRVDMTGLDPVTNPAIPSEIAVNVSAWNAPRRSLRAGLRE